jgi:vacuolar protein sorting-associated protein 13A/C
LLTISKDASTLEALEYKLSYEDIQLYRFLARRVLRKDIKAGKLQKDQAARTPDPNQQSSGGWGLGWLVGFGSSTTGSANQETVQTGNMWNMTDEQQQQLYDALGYDQDAKNNETSEAPDSLMMHVAVQLDRGSLTLKSKPQGVYIMTLMSNHFKADVLQRPENLEGTLALGDFSVFDGTTTGSAYPQIVRVQEQRASSLVLVQPSVQNGGPGTEKDPFLYLKFEHKPLDERADSALTIRLRYMEIIYHKSYVEAIYGFLRPPESQLESLDALLVSCYSQ